MDRCWSRRSTTKHHQVTLNLAHLIHDYRIFYLLFFNNDTFLISAELKMDVLRERECKDSMERQFADERKLRGKFH